MSSEKPNRICGGIDKKYFYTGIAGIVGMSAFAFLGSTEPPTEYVFPDEAEQYSPRADFARRQLLIEKMVKDRVNGVVCELGGLRLYDGNYLSYEYNTEPPWSILPRIALKNHATACLRGHTREYENQIRGKVVAEMDL